MITHDKDFGELAVLFQQPHAGVVRLVDVPLGESGSPAGACYVYARELAKRRDVTG